MARETPEKVVDEISKCCMCSSSSAAQEKIFVFDNSIHNFVEIIRSLFDFDISCLYAKLCYKRLLKFQRASEEVLELKKEIVESFHQRTRTKRLHNAGDESKIEQPESKTYRYRQ